MSQIAVVSFSPTGSTLKVAKTIASVWGADNEQFDLSKANFLPTVCQSDIAVIAMPVYAGRVPAVAIERLRRLTTKKTRAITVVVYGNRAYEDALLELNDEARSLGFDIVASAAVVAEHSVVGELATGRPNELDMQNLQSFARLVKLKIDRGETTSIEVPGNRPYREGMKTPVTPQVSAACVGCRLCVRMCPTQAISMADPKQTESDKCILCMRCIKNCPVKARSLPKPFNDAMRAKLSSFSAVVRENEFFL